jgi:3D-(3,5/4)-trihydroxycyclohexane-1,2-dione acylhydrolase (decyclizing)
MTVGADSQLPAYGNPSLSPYPELTMKTKRLTVAQALILFLTRQFIEVDGQRQRFFAGCFGIFGHGNLAGIGEALQEYPQLRYYQARNEQAMVHTAVAYARMKNRAQAFACTSSVGPGATNMVTGAALATINRLPVLLLPGDTFATRTVAPVLQQLESEHSQDISVNDCFKPVSRYWDRINRPEQLITTLPEAMRVLTSPAETGAVTLALPQDVQAEAFDFPAEMFEERTWVVSRPRADEALLKRAAAWIKSSKAPLIVAGGGVIYSGACDALAEFARATGIAVAETQAGKGSLHYQHPASLGALGATGTAGANIMAREADLVIGVGTRYSDFTTASKTAFQHPDVRFININVNEFDAHKHNAVPLTADARATLEELHKLLSGFSVDKHYRQRVADFQQQWEAEVQKHYDGQADCTRLSQAEVIGIVNSFSHPQDVVVCAAGSLPGDLHKLWRTRDPKGYHVEYGYSCMGYEIAGGIGIKMAAPEREVYVMVGDGSYLMMAQEIVTAIQEDVKINIVLLDNHGFASIGSLSNALGSGGFGTSYRFRGQDGQLSGDFLPIDFAANARSMGAHVIAADNRQQLQAALVEASKQKRTTVIVVATDTSRKVGGYESWWDVPVAQEATIPSVVAARKQYEQARQREKTYYKPADKNPDKVSQREEVARK